MSDWLDELEQRDADRKLKESALSPKQRMIVSGVSGLWRALRNEIEQQLARYRERFPSNVIEGPVDVPGPTFVIRKVDFPKVTLKITCCPDTQLHFEFLRTKNQHSGTEREDGWLKPVVDDSDRMFLECGDHPPMNPAQAAVFLLKHVVDGFHLGPAQI